MSHKNIPELPEEVCELAPDVLAELTQFEHIKREHGSDTRTGYAAGCRGPLCQRSDRIYNRQRYAQARIAEGKEYKPSDLRRDDREDELRDALAVYRKHRLVIEVHVRLTELYKTISDDLTSAM